MILAYIYKFYYGIISVQALNISINIYNIGN